jgi:hypothetical protein
MSGVIDSGTVKMNEAKSTLLLLKENFLSLNTSVNIHDRELTY